MPTLLEISTDLLELESQLEDLGGDVEAAGHLVDDWLTACALEQEKLDNYAGLIRDLELRAEARKAEAERMAARAKVDANRAAFLKERLKEHFIRHGRKTLETDRFRITHARHGGLRPVQIDVNPQRLPEAYRKARVQYSADMETIREALDTAEKYGRPAEIKDYAGRVIVRYGKRGSSIRIR